MRLFQAGASHPQPAQPDAHHGLCPATWIAKQASKSQLLPNATAPTAMHLGLVADVSSTHPGRESPDGLG